MSSIVANNKRVGNFTSSEIWKLTKMNAKKDGFGKPALTYIDRKRREKKLKRSLDTGAYSRDIAWGNFMEKRVFDLLGFEYKIESDETRYHPNIDSWSGSADLVVPNTKISDIKCYAPDNFSKYADVLEKKDVEIFKKEYEKEYWQLVANAAINSVGTAEAVLYMPYKSELKEIQEMAADYDGMDAWKYRFIYESEWWELPVLPDESEYKNLNIFEFEVPKEDSIFLEEQVNKAIILRDE